MCVKITYSCVFYLILLETTRKSRYGVTCERKYLYPVGPSFVHCFTNDDCIQWNDDDDFVFNGTKLAMNYYF